MSLNIAEKALRSAGIPSLEKGVPPKEYRGVAYWRRFVVATRIHAEALAERAIDAKRKVAAQAREKLRLQQELAEKDRLLRRHGLGER